MLVNRKILWIGVLFFFQLGVVIGCASTQKQQNIASSLFCGSKANIRYEIASEAEIANAKCFMAPYKGKDYLHFEIGIKNISKEQHRYRVSILLDEGPAIAGLYPRKVKKGNIVQPGKTVKRKLPMLYTKESSGFLIKVEVME